MKQHLNWQHLDNNQALAQTAADLILKSAKQAIAEKGGFRLVLAGGGTPENAYRLLIEAKTDWSKWHIYYGDERCLPVDDSERNSLVAEQKWLDLVAIPKAQIHRIAAELGAEAGAEQYAKVVAEAAGFDLVLLGMGEDGHTASLFPGHIHNVDELTH
ncbi:MAG: 6-phosphogluconolactonase, partial [Methylococcales bacterium]|nr:6-phosphogluconolactonase [Methylococcales bacterium]